MSAEHDDRSLESDASPRGIAVVIDSEEYWQGNLVPTEGSRSQVFTLNSTLKIRDEDPLISSLDLSFETRKGVRGVIGSARTKIELKPQLSEHLSFSDYLTVSQTLGGTDTTNPKNSRSADVIKAAHTQAFWEDFIRTADEVGGELRNLLSANHLAQARALLGDVAIEEALWDENLFTHLCSSIPGLAENLATRIRTRRGLIFKLDGHDILLEVPVSALFESEAEAFQSSGPQFAYVTAMPEFSLAEHPNLSEYLADYSKILSKILGSLYRVKELEPSIDQVYFFDPSYDWLFSNPQLFTDTPDTVQTELPADDSFDWLDELLSSVDTDREEKIRRQAIKEAQAAENEATKVLLSDIGGQTKAVEEARILVSAVNHPEVFLKRGIPLPKGILFTGPPGVGKTLMAKAIANEISATFVSVEAADIMSMWYGESTKNLAAVFDDAQKLVDQGQKVVIFIDELDSLAPPRATSYEATQRLVSVLLNRLDGMKSRSGIIFLAATNNLESVDPAVIRPGRIDTTIEFQMPDAVGLTEIFQIHCKKILQRAAEPHTLFDPSINLTFVALFAHKAKYSGAEVENLLQSVVRKKTYAEAQGRQAWTPITTDELIQEIQSKSSSKR